MLVDARLVLQFEDGQMAFRHINPEANYQQLFTLAGAVNSLQADRAERVLLVTVREM